MDGPGSHRAQHALAAPVTRTDGPAALGSQPQRRRPSLMAGQAGPVELLHVGVMPRLDNHCHQIGFEKDERAVPHDLQSVSRYRCAPVCVVGKPQQPRMVGTPRHAPCRHVEKRICSDGSTASHHVCGVSVSTSYLALQQRAAESTFEPLMAPRMSILRLRGRLLPRPPT